MNELTRQGEPHPAGEGDFTFATAGGRVRLSVMDDALTPVGRLVPRAAYTNHIGIVEKLAADCPVKRTSPNAAPAYDILQSFMLTALTDGRRFSHIERLLEDPTIPELFGMEAVVSDDTVRRFFKSIDPVLGAEWMLAMASRCGARCPIGSSWTGIRRCQSMDPRKERKSATILASRAGAVFIRSWGSWRERGGSTTCVGQIEPNFSPTI